MYPSKRKNKNTPSALPNACITRYKRFPAATSRCQEVAIRSLSSFGGDLKYLKSLLVPVFSSDLSFSSQLSSNHLLPSFLTRSDFLYIVKSPHVTHLSSSSNPNAHTVALPTTHLSWYKHPHHATINAIPISQYQLITNPCSP